MSTDRTIDNDDNNSIQSFDPKIDNENLAPVTKSETAGSSFRIDRDTVYINDNPIPKRDLETFIYASGGSLNVGAKPAPLRQFGNPIPAALFCFGSVCFTLGLIECGARSVTNASILIGSCFFSAGLVLIICAVWCLIIENTWGATVLFGFGGFWASYAAILCDAFGIASAYETAEELNNAIGLMFAAYVIFAFLLWVCTFKSTFPMFILFFFIWFFVMLLDIGIMTGHAGVVKAGGVFSFLSGIAAFYNAFAGMADKTNSYFVVKPWFMPGAEKPKVFDIENQA